MIHDCRTYLIAFAGLFAVAGPAAAEQPYCKRQGQMDAGATQTLQQMLERSDRQLMQFLSGTWYAQIPSPSTNQTSYMYVSYDPNGGFGYQNRVCSADGYCSDYQGVGVYAGVGTGGGQYTLMVMVSDNARDHECSGSTGRIAGNGMMQDATGTTWRKIK